MRYLFGPFELDTERFVLRRAGEEVHLEPRVLDLLAYLVEHPDRVISKDELVQEVWSGAFITDGALKRAVLEARRVLGDSGDHQTYIQTVYGRGYLFTAEIEALDSSQAVEREPRHAVRWAWILGGLAALLVLAASLSVGWWRERLPGRGASPVAIGSAAADLPRLAVLPFEDLGPPEDAYFAAGLTEEILSRLAVVQGLEVLSRTTMTSYDRKGKTVAEIGRDLDVDYLLEGTVRWDRVGRGRGRLRVTPQLTRVADDSQLWADRYDRDMADVFAVQSDIANHVVRALGVILSEREKRLVELRPTANLEAYQLYLRGLQTFADGQRSLLDNERFVAVTADLMRRATELDPGFALAHARLAWTLAFEYFIGGPAEQLDQARAALERAQALAPDHPEVRVVAGYLYYWGEEDYARALAEFEAIAAAMPSNAEAQGGAGAVLRRLGRYEEAIARFERERRLAGQEGAVTLLDPNIDIASCLLALRRYAEMDRILERQLEAALDRAQLWEQRALLWTDWRGTTDGAWALLAEAPESTQRQLVWTRSRLHLLDRDFAAAVGAVSGEPFTGQWRWLEVAYALRRLGRKGEATDLAGRIATFHQQALVANPDTAFAHQALGLAHALLGERQPALEHGRRAVELLASDAFWGPAAVETLAVVHTLLGDRDEAVRLVAELLAKDYQWPLNPQRLKLEPWWDPLREDPRFQELLAEGEAGAG
ncbi:MAG: winged helix-turn-helix domain-containing protein [Thermoanaerobaculia bacterium]